MTTTTAGKDKLRWWEWLIVGGVAASAGYGLLLLILSWLHIDPCSLHLHRRPHDDHDRT